MNTKYHKELPEIVQAWNQQLKTEAKSTTYLSGVGGGAGGGREGAAEEGGEDCGEGREERCEGRGGGKEKTSSRLSVCCVFARGCLLLISCYWFLFGMECFSLWNGVQQEDELEGE